MTANQVRYWENVETQRSNREKERETNRSNLARELETARSNRVQERETHRSNVARETETNRSNLANELELHRSNVTKEVETAKHNREQETLGWGRLFGDHPITTSWFKGIETANQVGQNMREGKTNASKTVGLKPLTSEQFQSVKGSRLARELLPFSPRDWDATSKQILKRTKSNKENSLK